MLRLIDEDVDDLRFELEVKISAEVVVPRRKSRFVCTSSPPETEKRRSPDESEKKKFAQAHSGDIQRYLETEGEINRRCMKEARFLEREEQKVSWSDDFITTE